MADRVRKRLPCENGDVPPDSQSVSPPAPAAVQPVEVEEGRPDILAPTEEVLLEGLGSDDLWGPAGARRRTEMWVMTALEREAPHATYGGGFRDA